MCRQPIAVGGHERDGVPVERALCERPCVGEFAGGLTVLYPNGEKYDIQGDTRSDR